GGLGGWPVCRTGGESGRRRYRSPDRVAACHQPPNGRTALPLHLELQLTQEFVPRRNVIEGLRRLIVLGEEVLDPRLLPLREDALPVDLALPHVDYLVVRCPGRVLHVH